MGYNGKGRMFISILRIDAKNNGCLFMVILPGA